MGTPIRRRALGGASGSMSSQTARILKQLERISTPVRVPFQACCESERSAIAQQEAQRMNFGARASGNGLGSVPASPAGRLNGPPLAGLPRPSPAARPYPHYQWRCGSMLFPWIKGDGRVTVSRSQDGRPPASGTPAGPEAGSRVQKLRREPLGDSVGGKMKSGGGNTFSARGLDDDDDVRALVHLPAHFDRGPISIVA